MLSGIGLVSVDLLAGGAGHDSDGLAVDVDVEAVIARGDADGLAGVDHADLDSLCRDHDLATLRHPSLHGDWSSRQRRADA